jgi:hypothetical protein
MVRTGRGAVVLAVSVLAAGAAGDPVADPGGGARGEGVTTRVAFEA